MEKLLLEDFLMKAQLATYAADSSPVEPQRLGHKELVFEEGIWRYRDSYTGYFSSFGQELIWRNDEPVWTQVYGGGMLPAFDGNRDFARETFQFLKNALGTKKQNFQPRGPHLFVDGNWEYCAFWEGDINGFNGHEEILHGNFGAVFTHRYLGGIIVPK